VLDYIQSRRFSLAGGFERPQPNHKEGGVAFVQVDYYKIAVDNVIVIVAE
jgi:hypothetical protein